MLAFTPTSTPRVGQSRISSFRSFASQRPRFTFCLLPPERAFMSCPIPVLFTESGRQAAELLKRHGKKIYAAEMDAGTELFDADLSEDAAVIIGNEGSGISDELLGLAEGVRIPMSGSIESLNAALAAGMIMYESQRQRLRGR